MHEQPPVQQAMTAIAWSLPFEHIAEGLNSAKLMGNGELKIGDRIVNCHVVVADYGPAKPGLGGTLQSIPITYWIDVKTNLVVQQRYEIKYQSRTNTTTITLVRYRLNPAIPDTRFTFDPPQGVTEQPGICASSGGGSE
jgi:outer membrane lipoprotein-sorting protein